MDISSSGAMAHQGSGQSVGDQLSEPFSRQSDTAGMAASVRREVEEQIKHEEATRELAPDAYRLSSLSEAAIKGNYRKGKETMGLGDLLDYFRETRQRRIRQVDFSADTAEAADTVAPDTFEETVVPVEVKRKNGFIDLSRSWFDTSEEKPERGTKTFTLSAFAVIATLSVSLMLLVAGSVMNRRGEKLVSDMNREISAAYVELSDLQAGRETREDLVLMRQIATEEYGMVDEEHLRMQYITLSEEDNIETYEEEGEEGFGLSALLSAIGISFGK